MADFDGALLSLGQLIGLIGSDRTINWVWFGDPATQILGKSGDTTDGLANHRQYLGQLIRSLKGETITTPPAADGSFSTGYSWVPLNDGDVQVGFVWSNSGALEIGFGAQANVTPVDLTALAKLLQIQNGAITPLIGDVALTGGVPSPPLALSVELKANTVPQSLAIGVTDTKSSNTRTLNFPPAAPATLPWDCARLTLFILEAWIKDQPAAAAVLGRVSNHLFPMFGEPAQPNISSFPLFGNTMGAAPDFTAWQASVLNVTSGSGAGALAFLWHLRALLTGNETATFLKGFVFMPLVGGASGGAAPTDPTAGGANYDPTAISQPGVYIGITQAASTFTLCLDVVTGQSVGSANNFLRIPLAQLTGSALTRPPVPSAIFANFLSSLPAECGLTATLTGSVWTVSFDAVLNGTGVAFFDGTYKLSAILDTTSANLPVRFEVASAMLPVTLSLPPGSEPVVPTPAALISGLAGWVIKAIPPDTTLAQVVADLSTFVDAELNVPGSGNKLQLVKSIGEALASGLSFDVAQGPPFSFNVSLAEVSPYFHVISKATYGPIDVDQIPSFPISIGHLMATLDLAIDKPGNPLSGFSLGFDDLRIGSDATSGDTGVISTLIPDLKKAPGFSFDFAWDTVKGITISGGGKIPIQLTLGPLSISQLQVDASNTSLQVGINLTFQLAVITINTYDLGIGYNYQSKTPSFNLNGLGLSFDAGGISLSGSFLKNGNDYIGTASVDVEDLFSLSAIGGYTRLQNTPSLFIFASLVAPLGGPPFFFITGIAGGFGYNRTLPPLTLMSKHPFIMIMSGKPLSNDPGTALTALDSPATGFAPKVGDFWIAAGIQFVSFGFINGKVIIAVAFGHDFSFNLLGIASFGIDPVAYFEIDILVTVDQEKFLLIAGVSPNSYLIHPDIFNLAGDFGLGVWHSGPHAGDFLVSIGGFHPYFHTPSYYPKLNRVSVKAQVFGFVHLDIECFFACTPQALMAGASVSLSATFAGIGAGLDVYIDVLIEWDPFFILATMGVTLWFEFLGRHEIGVDLQIHTPPFGGVATVHLFIVSFDVSFGSDIDAPPPPPVFNFITKRLGVPATAWNTKGAALNLYNTATAAGLIRVVFTSGRTVSSTGDGSKEQEGSTSPVSVAPEFSFIVRTHLPFLESAGDLSIVHPVSALGGTVNLPLCGEADLSSNLTMVLTNVTEKNTTIVIPNADIDRSADLFPYANFGAAALPSAQADNESARTVIAGIDTSHPAVPLTDGFSFNLVAQPQPATQITMTGPEEQLSDVTENYPLPLGWPASTPQITIAAKTRLQFAPNSNAAALATRITPQPTVDRRQMAVQQMTAASKTPWQIRLMTAQFNRAVITAAKPTTSVATVPAGAVTMAPPASPARRAELAAVTLSIMPSHIAQAPPKPVLKSVAALQLLRPVHSVLTAPAVAAATAPPAASVSVLSGHAAHLDISGNVRSPQGTLNFSGTQTVRAVFLTGFGEPLSDQYITGTQHVALPVRTRRVLLIGEGMLTGAPASLGSVGVEPGSSIFAISRTEFAAHGCVVRSNAPILKKFNPGDTLTGSVILSAGSSFSILFPAAPKPASLVIVVNPAVPKPAAAASQVRWRAVNATLSALTTLATPDGAAFIMDAAAVSAWNLDLDVDSDWKISSAVVANMSAADALTALSSHSSWSFVDDHFLAPNPALGTSVTLELVNG